MMVINGENITDNDLALWMFLSERTQILFNTPIWESVSKQLGLTISQVRRGLRRLRSAGMVYQETYMERENIYHWNVFIPVPRYIYIQSFHEESDCLEAVKKYAYQKHGADLEHFRNRFELESVHQASLANLPSALLKTIQSYSVDGCFTAKNKELSAELGMTEKKMGVCLKKLEASGMIYREIFQRRGVDPYPRRIIIPIPESVYSASYDSIDALKQAVYAYAHEECGGILEKWHQEVGYDPNANAWRY